MAEQEVVTRNASGQTESRWYVLSRSQTKYKEITESLIIKFEQLRKGLAPDFTAGKYEKMLEIRNAMHVVVQTNEGAGFPLSLSCRIALYHVCIRIVSYLYCFVFRVSDCYVFSLYSVYW